MGQAKDALDSEEFILGRRAGLMGFGASSLELRPSDPQDTEYLRGLKSGLEQRAAQLYKRLQSQSPCPYGRQDNCGCGGRGLCLDVA